MNSSSSIGSVRQEVPALDVLLVDDNPEVVESLAQYLEAVGYRAKAVFSPREALVLVRSIDRIGVVVLDYCMPVTDGLTLADEIRQLRHEDNAVELILLTAHANTELVFRAVKGAFFGFHEKPCRPRVLAETVAKALRSAEGRRLAAVDSRVPGLALRSHLPSEVTGASPSDAGWTPDAVLAATRARQYLNATRAGLRLSAVEGLATGLVRNATDVVDAFSLVVADAIDVVPENGAIFLSAQNSPSGVVFAIDCGQAGALPGEPAVHDMKSSATVVSEEPSSCLRDAAGLLARLGTMLVIEHRRAGPGGRYSVSFTVPTVTH